MSNYYDDATQIGWSLNGTEWNDMIENLDLFDLDTTTPLNSVKRVRNSDTNFCTNSAFQSWNQGTSAAPDGWTLAGTATIAQDSGTAYVGDYSVALTLGAATDGEFYAIFGASSLVDYTFSAYVTRTSGTGNMRMVGQQNFGSYVEDQSVACSTTSGQQLVTLTFKPSANGNYRVAFKATDAAGSTWRIDEVQVQESKGLATTWKAAQVDDSFSQNIYGAKSFWAGTVTTKQNLNPNGTLTIATGAITVTGSFHELDTEASAATDDLDTINGGNDGDILILQTTNQGRDVTVKNGTGNILCGSDRVLDRKADKITLIKSNGNWEMIAFADND